MHVQKFQCCFALEQFLIDDLHALRHAPLLGRCCAERKFKETGKGVTFFL
jgi:hypothetical protein